MGVGGQLGERFLLTAQRNTEPVRACDPYRGTCALLACLERGLPGSSLLTWLKFSGTKGEFLRWPDAAREPLAPKTAPRQVG